MEYVLAILLVLLIILELGNYLVNRSILLFINQTKHLVGADAKS